MKFDTCLSTCIHTLFGKLFIVIELLLLSEALCLLLLRIWKYETCRDSRGETMVQTVSYFAACKHVFLLISELI